MKETWSQKKFNEGLKQKSPAFWKDFTVGLSLAAALGATGAAVELIHQDQQVTRSLVKNQELLTTATINHEYVICDLTNKLRSDQGLTLLTDKQCVDLWQQRILEHKGGGKNE